MTHLAEQFEKKLESGELPQPISPWLIKTKRFALWSFFALTVLLGSASMAVAMWFYTDPAGLVGEYKTDGFIARFVDVLPLFWVILSLILGIVALAVFVNTPRSYRYRRSVIIAAILVSVLTFGGALSATSFAGRIESAADYIPGYHIIRNPRLQRFFESEGTMLIGDVHNIQGETFELRDPAGRVYLIDYSACQDRDAVFVAPQKCVRVIAEIGTDIRGLIDAKYIRPCPRGLRPGSLPPPAIMLPRP